MKVFLLGSDKSLYSNIRIIEECAKKGHELDFIEKQVLKFHDFEDYKNLDLVINRSSGIDYDDIDLDFVDHLKSLGKKSVNDPEQTRIHRDKRRAQFFLRRLGLNTIPTFFNKGPLQASDLLPFRHMAQSLCPDWAGEYVVKNLRGLGGKGVFLLDTDLSLVSYLNSRYQLGDELCLVQPRIKVKNEYRVFCLNQKIWAVLLRSAKDNEFRANFSQGGSALLIEHCPAGILNQIDFLNKNGGLNFYTVEFLESYEQQFYCLEVNTLPGFKEIELLTGGNMVGDFVDEITLI
jgi:gamma-F420-2:alpha-L-glutamate ligase